jgi:DMSO/TMAO reductase YedYZ molybdopterin-dependent catalytic subunit
MLPRAPRWTMQIQSRRKFLEQCALAAACAGVAACARDRSPGAPSQKDADASDTNPKTVTAYGPITPNDQFYITSCCGNPVVDSSTWLLSIMNRGTQIASVKYATLRNLTARKKEHTLECISAQQNYLAISNAIWTGLPLAEVFNAVGVAVPAGTLELVFRSVEGYSASLPVSDLDKPAWLVWLMNGVELPPEHGYPVRLLVPGRYGMKNPKWITSIDFVDQPFTGYWDEMGWSKEAPYLTNALVHVPSSDVPAGAIVANGTAFAGSDPVTSVDVSVDGGAWLPATLDYTPGPDIWTLWHHDMVLAAGSHSLQARCTTKSGSHSNPSAYATDYLAGFDASGLINFDVV